MDFLLSTDLREFAEVLRKVFAEKEDKQWGKLSEVGAFSAALPETAGGLGLGNIAAAVVLEEAGRALSPLLVYEALAFLGTLSGDGKRTEAGEKILAAAAEGKVQLTGALVGGCDVSVSGGAGVLTLSGICARVAARAECAYILVPARAGNLTGLFAVETAKLTDVRRVETFDLKRTYGNVVLDAVPAELLIEDFSERSFLLRTAVFASAELSGIAQRVVEMTNEYVKTRQQFGRPVGTFQAIQHKLADMHLRAEQAQSLTRFAAWALDSDPQQSEEAALAAKAFTGEFVPLLIEQSIQAHGGIGFTFEFELHHYLRRALVLAKGMMPPAECQELLGAIN